MISPPPGLSVSLSFTHFHFSLYSPRLSPPLSPFRSLSEDSSKQTYLRAHTWSPGRVFFTIFSASSTSFHLQRLHRGVVNAHTFSFSAVSCKWFPDLRSIHHPCKTYTQAPAKSRPVWLCFSSFSLFTMCNHTQTHTHKGTYITFSVIRGP